MHLSECHKDPEDPPCHNITDGMGWDEKPADGETKLWKWISIQKNTGADKRAMQTGAQRDRGGRRGVTGERQRYTADGFPRHLILPRSSLYHNGNFYISPEYQEIQ